MAVVESIVHPALRDGGGRRIDEGMTEGEAIIERNDLRGNHNSAGRITSGQRLIPSIGLSHVSYKQVRLCDSVHRYKYNVCY